MSLVDTLGKATAGATAGVAFITVLPVFGAAGAITAAGVAVGSVLGGAAGLVDSLRDD